MKRAMILLLMTIVLLLSLGGMVYASTEDGEEAHEGPPILLIFPFLMEEPFNLNFEDAAALSATWAVMAGVFLVLGFSSFRLGPKPTILQTFLFDVIESIENFLRDQMGEKGRRHLPFIGALAIFILIGNLIGLVPGVEGMTSRISTTLALALIVFVYYHLAGIVENGPLGYLRHFMGPKLPWYLFPINLFLFPIELISHMTRPLSLSLRLAGNMTGGHMVLFIMAAHVFMWLIPIPLYGLELLAAVVQTAVFVILTVIYINLATSHHEEEEHA